MMSRVRWFAEHGTHLRSTLSLEMEGFIDGPVVHLVTLSSLMMDLTWLRNCSKHRFLLKEKSE